MSSNIYEDPNLTMKYSKGSREDGGQRVERLVDIYQSVDTDHVSTRGRGACTQKHLPDVQRNPFKSAAVVLGLLCLLLLVGVIVLSILYTSITLEYNKLSIHSEELQTQLNILSKDDCQTQAGNQTQGIITEWKKFRCSCYYKSTEMKNWTESRKDCQTRGADLVIINSKKEHDFISELNKPDASWIGLQPVGSSWNWEWQWVDGSSPKYMAWKTDVKQQPMYNTMSTAYIDVNGGWNQINNGSKRWICEKKIYYV